MTLWVTPARRASSACVRPAAFRAARNTEAASFTSASIADRHYPSATDQDAWVRCAVRRCLEPTLGLPILLTYPVASTCGIRGVGTVPCHGVDGNRGRLHLLVTPAGLPITW